MGIYIVSIFFPIVNNAGVNIFAFLVCFQGLWVSPIARFCLGSFWSVSVRAFLIRRTWKFESEVVAPCYGPLIS